MSVTNKKQDIEKLKQELISYQNDLESHSQKFNGEIENIRKDMELKVSDYISDSIKNTDNIISDSSKIVDNLGSANEKVLKSDFTNLQQKLNSLFDNYHDDMDKLQTKSKELLKKQIDTIDSEKSNFSYSAKQIFEKELHAVNDLQKQYESIVKQTQEKLVTFLDREEENFKDSATSLEFIGSELNEFQKRAKIITQEIDNKIEKLFSKAVTDVEGHYEQSIQTIRNSANELVINLSDESQNRKKAIEEIKIELTKKINEDIANNISLQHQTQDRFNSSIDAFSTKQIESFDNILDSSSKRFSKELELKQTEVIEDITDIRKEFRENLYTGLNDISSGFSSFQEVFIDQIESLIMTLQKKSEEMQSSLQEIVIKKIGEVQNIAETMETKLENLAESNSKNFTDQYIQLKSDFDTEMQLKSKEFSNSINSITAEIKDIYSKSQDETKNQLKSINSSVNDTIAVEFDNSSIYTDKMLNKYKDGTATFVSDQTNWLSESKNKVLKDFERNKEELVANITSLEPEAERLTESQGEKIQEKRKEILEFLERSSKDVRQEVDGLERDAIQEISQLNLVIEEQINERSEDLHSKIQMIVENLAKSQKDQLSVFLENLSSKVSNSLEEIKALKPKAISETEKHITDYENKISIMVSDIQKTQANTEKSIKGFEDNLSKSKDDFNSNMTTVSNNSENTMKNIRKRAKKIIDKTDDILKKLD